MSVLDDFVRMRLYRKRAVELEMAAEGSLPTSVKDRYLIAAGHYWQVADAEEHAERATALSRLAHWNKASNPENRFARATAHKIAFRRTPLIPADLMEEVVRVLLKRAAKNAPLRTTWSLPNVYPEDQGRIRNSHKVVPFSLSRSDKAPPRKTSFARRAKTRARP